MLPAIVPCCEPVPTSIPQDSLVAVPGHPVGLPAQLLVTSLKVMLAINLRFIFGCRQQTNSECLDI